jgi:hypothetical protein
MRTHSLYITLTNKAKTHQIYNFKKVKTIMEYYLNPKKDNSLPSKSHKSCSLVIVSCHQTSPVFLICTCSIFILCYFAYLSDLHTHSMPIYVYYCTINLWPMRVLYKGWVCHYPSAIAFYTSSQQINLPNFMRHAAQLVFFSQNAMYFKMLPFFFVCS